MSTAPGPLFDICGPLWLFHSIRLLIRLLEGAFADYGGGAMETVLNRSSVDSVIRHYEVVIVRLFGEGKIWCAKGFQTFIVALSK